MDGFCDPHCRQITTIDILSSSKKENEQAMDRQGEECTEQVDLIFGVTGTYWTCPDESFPGLFSDSSEASSVVAEARQAMPKAASCPACPGNSVTPSPQDYAKAMTPFVTVLGPVCDLVSMNVVNLDDGTLVSP
jgi:hypothetical protein